MAGKQHLAIGWKLVDGRFETRGPESFEVVVKSAKETEQLVLLVRGREGFIPFAQLSKFTSGLE